MTLVFAIVLIIIGVIFAANLLGTLSGRYGPARRVQNALLAGGLAVAAFVGASLLLS